MLHTRWFPFLLVIIPLVLICTFERLNEILWSNDMLGWLNPFTWFWGGTFEWLVFSADYVLPCCLVPVQIMAPYYSFRQRSFLARTYHETQSYVEVSRRFAARYPRERRVPTKGCIATAYNVRKFSIHGTVKNRHNDGSGRPRSARSYCTYSVVSTADMPGVFVPVCTRVK
mgnify:CR=1 FL=1